MKLSPLKPAGTIALVLACSGILIPPAGAEGVHASAVSASAAESLSLIKNPLLMELAQRNPQALEQVMALIDEAIAHPSDTRGGLKSVDDGDAEALEENPALMRVWRSSPQAALDLLRLIREASKLAPDQDAKG